MCFSEANAAASGVSFPTASVVAAGGRNRISTVMPRSMRANNDSNATFKCWRCSRVRSLLSTICERRSSVFDSMASSIDDLIFLSNISSTSFSLNAGSLRVSARTFRMSSTCFHVLSAHVTAPPIKTIVATFMCKKNCGSDVDICRTSIGSAEPVASSEKARRINLISPNSLMSDSSSFLNSSRGKRMPISASP